jgi:hypothetical protein
VPTPPELVELRGIVSRSRDAYVDAKLARAEAKSVDEQEIFEVLGTHVNGHTGRVGLRVDKLHWIATLLLWTYKLGYNTGRGMRRLGGLVVNAFMHKRSLMSCLDSFFEWVDPIPRSASTGIPAHIGDELIAALLLLPLASSNIRWDISNRISATDATPTRCGGVDTYVPGGLSASLYRLAEHRGEHVRVDWNMLDEAIIPTTMNRPQDRMHELVKCLKWEQTRAFNYHSVEHVNIQELKAIAMELKSLAVNNKEPCRSINFVDSRVSLGAWSKGRSSSHALNRVC